MIDVLVLGGGPAGAAAALVLARAGRRVSLVHGDDGRAFRPGEGLPPTARPLLRELGVMERFLADGHLLSYGNESAWGTPALTSTDFIRQPHGHGWHLHRARFDAMLRDAARDAGAVVVDARIVSAAREGDAWHVELASGATVDARTVIDATGRASWLARRAGAARIDDDALRAWIAVLDDERGRDGDEDSATLVESVATGWWYTALLPKQRRIVVFHSDADIVGPLDGPRFLDRLDETDHVRRRCRGFRPRTPFPLVRRANSAHLDRLHGDGWLAAGDAALSFDPLSSQGIITALYAGTKAGLAAFAHLAGDADAPSRYEAMLHAIYADYRRRHRIYYAAERRWREEPFWQRRSQQTVPSSSQHQWPQANVEREGVEA